MRSWIFFMKNHLVLLVLFTSLVIAALISGKYVGEMFSGLIGAVLGAAATVYAADKQQERTRREQFEGALNALRAEVEFNGKLLSETDQKLVIFSTLAWGRFGEFTNFLSEESRNDLNSLYGYIMRHAQAVHLELIKETQGKNLADCADKISKLIRKIEKEGIV